MMPKSDEVERREVVIVGAGPVGLTLALALARAEVDVLVLEKNESTAEHSRAPGIWSRSQQIFDELGVLDSLVAEGTPLPRLRMWDVDRARPVLEIPVEDLKGETDYARLLILPQSSTERLLLEEVRANRSADVRFGCEVTSIRNRGDVAVIEYLRDGEQRRIEASVVAGCDGAHSIVREEIGGSLEGTTYRMEAALADVRLKPDGDFDFPRMTTRPRLAIAIRLTPDLWRLILPFDPKGETIELDQRIRDAAGSLFPGHRSETIWKSEFRLHRRLSTKWIEGRLVLAGDAAHLNSPVGGQGMNAGILDASILAPAIVRALREGSPGPLREYADRRREQLRKGVNPFTDRMTRILFSGRARFVRPVLRCLDLALRIPPLKRRFLRRLAMLDSP